VCKHWDGGATSVDTIFLVSKLNGLKAKSPYLSLVYELCGDWDVTLWLMCQIACAVGALPRFEEFCWLSAVSGNNGKGTLINLMMALLNSNDGGYYGQLDFEKHFLGSGTRGGNNVNNPDIAMLEGVRLTVVNETPGLEGSDSLNTNLIKRLVSLDAGISSTAKYKDPSMWTSMMLLMFMYNEAPNLGTDPSLYTRLSYLFLPYSFVGKPRPGTNEKAIDTRIKEMAKNGVYNAEVLFWCVQLTPYLLKATSDRQVQPRPEKVKEDSASHLKTATANKRDERSTADIASDFVMRHLKEWKPTMATAPASREHINDAFMTYCKSLQFKVPNPVDALVGGGYLLNHLDKTRFKVMFKGNKGQSTRPGVS
jgi:hypothetical protein